MITSIWQTRDSNGFRKTHSRKRHSYYLSHEFAKLNLNLKCVTYFFFILTKNIQKLLGSDKINKITNLSVS